MTLSPIRGEFGNTCREHHLKIEVNTKVTAQVKELTESACLIGFGETMMTLLTH